MASINNIQGYSLDKPSTKVHQAPGGNSSISFGDYQQPAAPVKRNVRDPNQGTFSLGGDAPYQQQPQKQQQAQQQQQQQAQGADVHTSVKVRNPPGGQSQIQFG